MGSGGGTLSALVGARVDAAQSTLVLHSGGDSQRNPVSFAPENFVNFFFKDFEALS